MPVPRQVNNFCFLYLNDVTSRIVAKSGRAGDRFHLGKIILESLKVAPDMDLQIDAATGQSESFKSTLTRSVQCARYLRASYAPGDVIALMAPNHLDLTVPIYASLFNGLTVAAVEHTWGVGELQDTFSTIQPKLVCCQHEKQEVVREALQRAGVNANIITFGGGEHELNELIRNVEPNVDDFSVPLLGKRLPMFTPHVSIVDHLTPIRQKSVQVVPPSPPRSTWAPASVARHRLGIIFAHRSGCIPMTWPAQAHFSLAYATLHRSLANLQPRLLMFRQRSSLSAVGYDGQDTRVEEPGPDLGEGNRGNRPGCCRYVTDVDTAENIAFLVPTSGTTGAPKNAACSHLNFATHLPYWLSLYDTFPSPTRLIFHLSPLQWVTGIMNYLLSAIFHVTRVQTSAPSSVEHYHSIINKYKPTFMICSPTMMATMVKHSGRDSCDFSCFEIVMLGGSAVTRDIGEEIKIRAPNAQMVPNYGLTEMGMSLCGSYNINKPVCFKNVGVLKLRLVDPDTGKDVCEPFKSGELWGQGPSIFKGYCNRPEATKEAFSEDGWLKTGDIFQRDEDLNYYFVDRLKMLMKYMNYQISPVEVETVIKQHPGVSDAGVAGVPHSECGELPVACVVRKQGASVTAQEIKDLVKCNQDWTTFKTRLQQWFIANGLDDDTDKAGVKRRAILISTLNDDSFQLASNLVLPKKLEDVAYKDIVQVLDQHFTQKRCGFAERLHFYAAVQQASESHAQWAARLRGLAAHCSFKHLEEALLDKFVMGMTAGAEREKLFSMDIGELTLAKAVELASSVRTARAAAACAAPAAATTSDPLFKIDKGSDLRNSGNQSERCSVCGRKSHSANTCRFSKFKCTKCNQKGHLRRMCKTVKYVGAEELAEGDDGELFNIRCIGGAPMVEAVIINNIKLNFELDSGSTLELSPIKFCAQTNSDKKVPLEKTLSEFATVFEDRLGCFNKFKIKLQLKEDAKPVFFKSRPVAFALKEKIDTEINRLLQAGVIESVDHSEYASPVVPVLKEDAPAIFQRAMESILDLEGVLVFLDDVCITGDTYDEHLRRLNAENTADFLSRAPLPETSSRASAGLAGNAGDVTAAAYINFVVEGALPVTSEQLSRETSDDVILRQVINNGQAESCVKIVKKGIKTALLAGGIARDVNNRLLKYLFDYRNSVHSTTGRTPASLVFGWQPRSRLDLLTVPSPSPPSPLSDKVRNNQFLQNSYHEGVIRKDFDTNDVVLYKLYVNKNKFNWCKGLIVEKVGLMLFKIKDLSSGSIITRHRNQIILYKGLTSDSDHYQFDLDTAVSGDNGGEEGAAMPAEVQPPPAPAPPARADPVPSTHGMTLRNKPRVNYEGFFYFVTRLEAAPWRCHLRGRIALDCYCQTEQKKTEGIGLHFTKRII
ncbi:unnamed protein product [Plutella xylostella]|uniref:(diamondback moth) hypothetical protein n=1 Tax=Plutella xylostella TaxID=51655 RepID=A0A8S4DQZ6_PLUXY|nr:unnamed protein product [Plutella xylostella]